MDVPVTHLRMEEWHMDVPVTHLRMEEWHMDVPVTHLRMESTFTYPLSLIFQRRCFKFYGTKLFSAQLHGI